MRLLTEGLLGIVGGNLLLVSIPISTVFFVMMYGVGMAPVYDIMPAPSFPYGLLFVSEIVVSVVSAFVLMAMGTLLTLGKGRTAFAVIMIVFGVIGMVFCLTWIGGILGAIASSLGIVSGALSIKAIRKQEATTHA